MHKEIENLECRINQMREKLILIAVEKGLNSEETIYYSQKLDELIEKYQKIKKRHIQNIG